MKTTTKENGAVVLTADEGMRLYNGRGVYALEVLLGKYGSASDWQEVSEAEYEATLKQTEISN